jgi:hypothetical protein
MTIFEIIKFWWRVKKANRKLLKRAKMADRTPYETTKEDVDKWLDNNPFEITRELLNQNRTEYIPKRRAVHIFRDLS